MQANLYGMGRDPALFADPEVFRPERWLRGDAEDNLHMKALTNLAWGHGARMCIGKYTKPPFLRYVKIMILPRYTLHSLP